uniref:Rho family GTPase 2 n=1 Tax=Chrysemys picta bellii TaxID=8478 RepID=A0A8C3HT73_CHRPI
MWDTSGSAYYDNVRPLAYPDSDAVLICFDISRPETLDSVLKKWQGETQEFCPNAKIVLVGCKLDMRTDLNILRELSKQRLIPVTHEQVCFSRGAGVMPYVLLAPGSPAPVHCARDCLCLLQSWSDPGSTEQAALAQTLLAGYILSALTEYSGCGRLPGAVTLHTGVSFWLAPNS